MSAQKRGRCLMLGPRAKIYFDKRTKQRSLLEKSLYRFYKWSAGRKMDRENKQYHKMFQPDTASNSSTTTHDVSRFDMGI